MSVRPPKPPLQRITSGATIDRAELIAGLVLAALVVAILSLAGCAHAPRPVEVRTQIVKVPSRAPCPAPDEHTRLAKLRPAPLRSTPAPVTSLERAAAVVAQLLRYEGPGGWAEQVDAALDRCQLP